MPESPALLRVRLRAGALATIAAVTLLAAGGCAGAPAPTPAPTSSAAANPIFATDEEALAAAEAAYEKFLVASAVMTGSGGSDTSALEAVAAGEALAAQVESAEAYAKEHIHSTGRREFETHKLQSVEPIGKNEIAVTFYVCDDLRGLTVLREDGSSAVSPDRVVDVPYLVTVEGGEQTLKVSGKDLWERENYCL